nr:MAG TPA: Type I restriction enzyme [Caudoviricetes sp.]
MNLFSNNPDFYPTPNEVIEQMMLGEDYVGKTVLEPSAGSGNIVKWLKLNGSCNVVACENDITLRKLLNNVCPLVGDDFLKLTADQVSYVDLIVMNPPFSHGAEHIMHAWEIAPSGCTIIALCNSTNVNATCYREYRKLQEVVNLYGCSEFLGDVFSTSERKTNVNVSLVKLYKQADGEDEFSGYFFSQEDEDAANQNTKEGLIPYNVVRDLVNRYISAVKLFDSVMEASNQINEIAKVEKFSLPIYFTAVNAEDRSTTITRAQYKKELQKYYWRVIFRKLNMEKFATSKLHQQINRFVEKQSNVPFTMKNVYSVLNMVIQTTGQRMRTALSEAFDLICSLSAENSTAGETWKTNANYMVNRKFIVSWITEYDTRWPNPFVRLKIGGNKDRIEDVCKALCFLTGTDYNNMESLSSFVGENQLAWGGWFDWGFFRCRAYKKGTMHFEFKDEKVWMMFNQEVAKERGWSLPKKQTKNK